MARKKRTADERWEDAEANGHKPLAECDHTSETVRKKLEKGTKTNYDRMQSLWDAWVSSFPYENFVVLANHIFLVKQIRETTGKKGC
jgi:hypothetical protein